MVILTKQQTGWSSTEEYAIIKFDDGHIHKMVMNLITYQQSGAYYIQVQSVQKKRV